MKHKLTQLISIIIIANLIWQDGALAQSGAFHCLRTMALEERGDKRPPAGLAQPNARIAWLQENVPELANRFVASFAMECCVYELPPFFRDGNFAGGLGIDEMDLVNGSGKIGINEAGFIPLYSRRVVQKIRGGQQVFEGQGFYDEAQAGRQPQPVQALLDNLEQVIDKNGKPVEFDVWGLDLASPEKDKSYRITVYKVKGRKGPPLYLFWCPEVFDFIYPTDEYRDGRKKREKRFLQETIYGRCVTEFFKRWDALPDIYHLNEGHVAGVITAMHDLDDPNKKTYVYINHSVVEGALERFSLDEINGGTEERIRYLGFPSPQHYKEDWERFITILPDGRKVIDMSRGVLSTADMAVGVSAEHAKATQELFPWYRHRIKDVLNGSGDFWVMNELLEMERNGVVPTKEDLLRINKEGEAAAFKLIQERTSDMTNKEGKLISETGIALDPNKPTVWLVRRLAEYKSQMPVLRDIIRVMCAERDQVVDTKWGKKKGLGMQVVVGGLAPQGTTEARWIEEFVSWMEDPQLKGRFVFVPGGGSELLRAQAIGGGICINCPLPKKEACGTSDQRKARNGGINLATRSGGPPEYIVDGESGFLVGSYGDDADFYERAPKDILDKLVVCSDMYYGHREKGDARWADMMLASYLASRKVTDEAMAKRYAIDVYRPGLRIKRLYLLGRRIGELALQQARQQIGMEAKAVSIIFAGPRCSQKTEVISVTQDILRSKNVRAQLIEAEEVPGSESLSFNADTIILNTDIVSNGFVDRDKFRDLVSSGITDAMREQPIPAATPVETSEESIRGAAMSSILRAMAFNERFKNLTTEELGLLARFRNYPGFDNIPSRYRSSFFSVLRIARVLENMGATILEFEKSFKVTIKGTPYEDKVNPAHERTGVDADIVISLRSHQGAEEKYLVEAKGTRTSGLPRAYISHFFHPTTRAERNWGPKQRYEVCAKLLGYKVILAIAKEVPGYQTNTLVPVGGEDNFYVLAIREPVAGRIKTSEQILAENPMLRTEGFEGILVGILSEFGSIEAMAGLNVVELGPASHLGLFNFLRQNNINVIGIGKGLKPAPGLIAVDDYNDYFQSAELCPGPIGCIYARLSLDHRQSNWDERLGGEEALIRWRYMWMVDKMAPGSVVIQQTRIGEDHARLTDEQAKNVGLEKIKEYPLSSGDMITIYRKGPAAFRQPLRRFMRPRESDILRPLAKAERSAIRTYTVGRLFAPKEGDIIFTGERGIVRRVIRIHGDVVSCDHIGAGGVISRERIGARRLADRCRQKRAFILREGVRGLVPMKVSNRVEGWERTFFVSSNLALRCGQLGINIADVIQQAADSIVVFLGKEPFDQIKDRTRVRFDMREMLILKLEALFCRSIDWAKVMQERALGQERANGLLLGAVLRASAFRESGRLPATGAKGKGALSDSVHARIEAAAAATPDYSYDIDMDFEGNSLSIRVNKDHFFLIFNPIRKVAAAPKIYEIKNGQEFTLFPNSLLYEFILSLCTVLRPYLISQRPAPLEALFSVEVFLRPDNPRIRIGGSLYNIFALTDNMFRLIAFLRLAYAPEVFDPATREAALAPDYWETFLDRLCASPRATPATSPEDTRHTLEGI